MDATDLQAPRCRRGTAAGAAAAIGLALAAGPVHAQGDPGRAMRLLVGFAPGGANDILARIVGPELGKAYGQNVVVDNRPGAAGTIGADILAKSAPDGQTLFLGSTGTNAIAPTLYSRLPYDPVKDLLPVSLVSLSANLVLVNPSLPAKSVAELVSLTRANPGKYNYSSSGNGSTLHLAVELFKSIAGVDLVHVPYKGDAPALADVVAGQIHMTFSSIPPGIGFARSGKLRLLAVTSGRRLATLPDVPTVAESGVPGYDVTSWYGLFVPGATPAAAVERLSQEAKRIVELPAVREQMVRLAVEPASSTPVEFRRFVQGEIDKWGKVVRAVGARAD